MELRMYGILDLKLGACMRPFFMQNDGVAIRAFADYAVSSDSEISKHPEDYALYALGKFDCEKMEFTELETRSLAKAVDFLGSELREVK